MRGDIKAGAAQLGTGPAPNTSSLGRKGPECLQDQPSTNHSGHPAGHPRVSRCCREWVLGGHILLAIPSSCPLVPPVSSAFRRSSQGGQRGSETSANLPYWKAGWCSLMRVPGSGASVDHGWAPLRLPLLSDSGENSPWQEGHTSLAGLGRTGLGVRRLTPHSGPVACPGPTAQAPRGSFLCL